MNEKAILSIGEEYIPEKNTCLYSPIFGQLIKGKMDFIYNNSVITNEFFEFEVCKSICEFALPGTDIIDIGANIGLVTLGVKKIFVSLMPLDLFYNLFENKISVIKIDVEGMEYNVLAGAKNLIEKHKPAIIVEIFDENIVKINDLMKSYNYINKGLIFKKYVSQDYLFTYNS